MLNRLPGKARGLTLKRAPSVGIPLLGHIAAGDPQIAFQDPEEFILASPELFSGSELFALRVKGESMKDAGILPGDIAVMNRQSEVADGEIAAVLLDDEATLKHVYRPHGRVVLRGANPAFLDIVIREGGLRSVCILGKYVGLIRDHGSPR
jgi:repressor LexA